MTTGNSQIDIYNDLIAVGTCKRCILRFIGAQFVDFNVPETELNKICNLNLQRDEQDDKKLKSNSCSICLDLLQDEFLEKMISSSLLDGVAEYDTPTFVNFISVPTSVLIREFSVELYLKEKYSEFYKEHRIFAINKTWSLSIQNKLSSRICKKFDKNSTLQIQFITSYEDEEKESSIMHNIENSLKKTKQTLSRNIIAETLKTIDGKLFRKHFSIPPEPPTNSLVISDVQYNNEAIYVAGRYCKYSRLLGQTPWVVDNVKVVENSVQDIIFEQFEKVFNCKTLVFSSSGREDCNVRTLGRGRPFVVKICDSKTSILSFDTFREIEQKINDSQLIKVTDLQFIDRKLLTLIKDGEEFKKKTYRALCVVDKPENLQTYIEKINNTPRVVLQQKTPVRVFHRRSSGVRQREIYKLSARLIPGKRDLFELDLVTQAGTYVKEFVHGDLGRTKPSLRELIGGYVDIITLDVMDVELDFPPKIIKSLEN